MREIFLLLAKNYRHGCENRNLSTFRNFWGKLGFFFKWNMFANIFGLRDEKNRAFGQKIFFRVFTTGIRASSGKFWGKRISLSRMFFCYHFWSLSDFLVFLQNCLVRCAKPPITVQSEINGKINLEKLFSLNNFGLWAEKTWTFSKTVRHDSRNRSLHVQMIIFINFSGSKSICRKIFGHRTETSDFQRKGFLRLVKGTFQVSSATLWKKDDKIKLYIFWLV